MDYGVSINEKSEMKQIVDACAELGSPSALYYKGMELMGTPQKPPAPKLYETNKYEAIATFSKLKESDNYKHNS